MVQHVEYILCGRQYSVSMTADRLAFRNHRRTGEDAIDNLIRFFILI